MTEPNSLNNTVIFPIESLPPELLLKIFGYLNIHDLRNLLLVCSSFHRLIRHYWDTILFNRREQFLVTNQLDEYIQKRSPRQLAPYCKHRISTNWQVGRYEQINRFFDNQFIPYFHLEKHSIWLGKGDSIRCYQRYRNNIKLMNEEYQLKGVSHKDVCRFVVKDNVASTVNGGMVRLFCLEQEEFTSNYIFKGSCLSCVDMESKVLAVGTKEGDVKLLHITDEYNLELYKTVMYMDRIWCLALQDNKLALGTAANNFKACINIADAQSGRTIHEFIGDRLGAGILHMKWEGSDTLWAGGYDGTLRKWDLRTGGFVQKFVDPMGSKVNCFDYDYVNSILTGGDRNRATLWDTRNNKYVQVYFMKSNTFRSRNDSPIMCISFDAEHMFAATDFHMNILNFSVQQGEIQDYSNVFFKQLVI